MSVARLVDVQADGIGITLLIKQELFASRRDPTQRCYKFNVHAQLQYLDSVINADSHTFPLGQGQTCMWYVQVSETFKAGLDNGQP